MTAATTRPRHARKEIRDFADWLADNGWTYDHNDNDHHTIWVYKPSGESLTLPETPRAFNVRRMRNTALRKMGKTPTGKRHPKPYTPPKATPRESLTGAQLRRTCGVITATCDQLAAIYTAAGYDARLIDRVKAEVLRSVQESA